MQNVAFDFMAKDEAHCLYHVGFSAHKPDYLLNLHKTSHIAEAARAYGINVKFDLQSNPKLYFQFLIALFKRQKIEILGAHLYQLILLLPLLVIGSRKTIVIHMHGQATALENENSIKYKIWFILSQFCRLTVSNPAWQGPRFVKNETNFNVFNIEKPNKKQSENDAIIERSKIGQRVTYTKYVEGLSLATQINVDFDAKYYAYSPSGRLSEANLFDLLVVAQCSTQEYEKLAAEICAAYGVRFKCVRK